MLAWSATELPFANAHQCLHDPDLVCALSHHYADLFTASADQPQLNHVKSMQLFETSLCITCLMHHAASGASVAYSKAAGTMLYKQCVICFNRTSPGLEPKPAWHPALNSQLSPP